jgi:hypothetical protein
MSLPPITIPDLDNAGPINPNGDFLPIRQGLNDKKVTPAQLSSVRMEQYTDLPNAIINTDVLLVGRLGAGGTYTTHKTNLKRIGFYKGIRMWFYEAIDTAVDGWQLVIGSGDRILATRSTVEGKTYYNHGQRGKWQQSDHILTINQIPAHTHSMVTHAADNIGKSQEGRISSTANIKDEKSASTKTSGGGQAHNHGSDWRPAANVGILCEKMF